MNTLLKEKIPPLFPVLFSWPKVFGHARLTEGVAKHKGKRRFNLRKVKVAASMSIGALASLDVISAAGTSPTTNTLRVMSVDCAYGISDEGAGIDDGYQFGWAHSDYSAAEIEECLEATASMGVGNKIEQERANRLVREVGMFGGGHFTPAGGGQSFNDGQRVKTKLNWLLAIGDTLDLWVRNASGTVYSSGTDLLANGDLWVKD